MFSTVHKQKQNTISGVTCHVCTSLKQFQSIILSFDSILYQTRGVTTRKVFKYFAWSIVFGGLMIVISTWHTSVIIDNFFTILHGNAESVLERIFCKVLWKKKLRESVFNPFPNKPWLLRVCSTRLLKTLWEKEKLLVSSNFSFSHSVFYPFGEVSAVFIKFEIVVCKLF